MPHLAHHPAQITAGGTPHTAPLAVITLPLGVLKAGAVTFSPPLPNAKTNPMSRVGMGTLNKVILGFPTTARWPNVNWFNRSPLPSDQGRWREFFSLRRITRRPVMVAFNAGAVQGGALAWGGGLGAWWGSRSGTCGACGASRGAPPRPGLRKGA